jgi:cyanate permease
MSTAQVKKLAMIAAVVAFTAPAMAQQYTQDDIREVAAMMVGYQALCGDLGPRSLIAMQALTASLDKSEAAAAALNMSATIQREGTAHWCNRMKPTVDSVR